MGGGGGAPQQTSSTQTTQIPAWLEAAGQRGVERAEDLSQRDVQQNPYTSVAPVTADQNAAYQTFRDVQGQATPYYQQALKGYQGLTPGASLLTPGQVTDTAQGLMNPYTSAVIDPTIAQMRQGLATNLQQIGKSASDAGAYGGSRHGVVEGVAQGQEAMAEGKLVADLMDKQYDTATGQAIDLSKTNLQTGVNALGALSPTANAMTTNTTQLAGLLQQSGLTQQQQEQAINDMAAANWQDVYNQPVQNLDVFLSSLGAVPYGTTTKTVGTGPAPQSNVAGQVMGGISTAVGIAGLGIAI